MAITPEMANLNSRIKSYADSVAQFAAAAVPNNAPPAYQLNSGRQVRDFVKYLRAVEQAILSIPSASLSAEDKTAIQTKLTEMKQAKQDVLDGAKALGWISASAGSATKPTTSSTATPSKSASSSGTSGFIGLLTQALQLDAASQKALNEGQIIQIGETKDKKGIVVVNKEGVWVAPVGAKDTKDLKKVLNAADLNAGNFVAKVQAVIEKGLASPAAKSKAAAEPKGGVTDELIAYYAKAGLNLDATKKAAFKKNGGLGILETKDFVIGITEYGVVKQPKVAGKEPEVILAIDKVTASSLQATVAPYIAEADAFVKSQAAPAAKK